MIWDQEDWAGAIHFADLQLAAIIANTRQAGAEKTIGLLTRLVPRLDGVFDQQPELYKPIGTIERDARMNEQTGIVRVVPRTLEPVPALPRNTCFWPMPHN